MIGVVCDTTIFIDHAPADRPARARPLGRAQQAGSAGGHARQTTESTTSPPPQAALTLLCVVKRYFMIEFWLGDWVVGGQVPWSEGGSGGS
jgi:hypothetical protein